MKYFFSAGEASGDLHAAQVIRNLLLVDPNADIEFLGGDEMASEVGHEPLIHYKRMAFMGFIDVARHLPQVLENFRIAEAAIEEMRPDAGGWVDYLTSSFANMLMKSTQYFRSNLRGLAKGE